MWRSLPALALALPLFAFGASEGAAEMTAPIVPEITLHASDGMLRVEGLVSSEQAQTVSATLVVQHQGQGGSMNTTQSSNLDLAPGQRVRVATAGINFGPESKLVVDLSVMLDGKQVAHSRTVIGAEDHD